VLLKRLWDYKLLNLLLYKPLWPPIYKNFTITMFTIKTFQLTPAMLARK